MRESRELTRRNWREFLTSLYKTITNEYARFKRMEIWYKNSFAIRVRRTTGNIKRGDYVFIDPTDGGKKKGRFQSPAEGPYLIQKRSERTITIDRKGSSEVINSDRVTKEPPQPNAPVFNQEPA